MNCCLGGAVACAGGAQKRAGGVASAKYSDIAVTLNVYTHVGLEDAENELRKMQTLEGARKEMGLSDKDDKPLKQNMFKVI